MYELQIIADAQRELEKEIEYSIETGVEIMPTITVKSCGNKSKT